jgi:hypothetical protein
VRARLSLRSIANAIDSKRRERDIVFRRSRLLATVGASQTLTPVTFDLVLFNWVAGPENQIRSASFSEAVSRYVSEGLIVEQEQEQAD